MRDLSLSLSPLLNASLSLRQVQVVEWGIPFSLPIVKKDYKTSKNIKRLATFISKYIPLHVEITI